MISFAALLLAASSAQTAGDTIFSDGFELVDTACPSTPLTRLTTSDIRYPNTGNSIRYNVDVTQFDNIWGHATNSDPLVTWPGRSGTQPAIMDFGKTQYVAAQFHATADVSPVLQITMRYGTYLSGPDLILAVSRICGDFDPATAYCVSTAGAGAAFAKFVIDPYTNGCPLAPDTDYYVNIKMDDPQPQDCNGHDTCALAINDTLGTQP